MTDDCFTVFCQGETIGGDVTFWKGKMGKIIITNRMELVSQQNVLKSCMTKQRFCTKNKR